MEGRIDALSRVGAVVVTYRSAKTIAECLRALPLSRLAGVVVVDNDSPDDTVATIEGLQLADVRLLRQPNRGFGAGNNLGLATLTPSEFVLFVNPDATIHAGDIEKLVAYLENHLGCAITAPRLYRQGQPLHSAGALASLPTELRPLLPRQLGRLLPARRLPVDYARSGPVGYVEGACMLARRDVLEEVGAFDERYFLFFEEMDLAQRLRRVGKTVDLCADARAEHLVAVSRSSTPFEGQPHFVRSMLRYLDRWHGRRAVRVYAAAARTSWWLRAHTGRLDRATHTALLTATRDWLQQSVPHERR